MLVFDETNITGKPLKASEIEKVLIENSLIIPMYVCMYVCMYVFEAINQELLHILCLTKTQSTYKHPIFIQKAVTSQELLFVLATTNLVN